MSTPIQTLALPSGQNVLICQGDLTEETVDAIVNAANAHLQHGGGLAGAIVHKGGYEIQLESNAWIQEHGPVGHANPAYTGPGRLPCRVIIHAVGPVWGSGDEDRKLGDAVTGSLALAETLGLSSIAFPAISTGIFGFPKERAAAIILKSIRAYFEVHPASHLQMVKITLFDPAMVAVFVREVKNQSSGNSPTSQV